MRVKYPDCEAISVPIEIFSVVSRVANAGPFSGRSFHVEKGTLAAKDTTEVMPMPGLPLTISAIPAKAVLGVSGSSTATSSDASCVDPSTFEWDAWHAHYLRYLVSPLPEEFLYRARSTSRTFEQEFKEPVANACPWEIPALEFRSAAPAEDRGEVPPPRGQKRQAP